MSTEIMKSELPQSLIIKQEEMSVDDLISQVKKIKAIMDTVMRVDEHYGVIPGTKKPTLLKSGAEKLCLTFRLDPQYESIETFDGAHLNVKSRCTLYHITTQLRLGSGEGSCSTKESKYAYREGKRVCPLCKKDSIIKGKTEYGGGWLCFAKKGGCGAKFTDDDQAILSQVIGLIPNENVADQYNTVLKMANKRSLIAAVLNVTAASDLFTQDMEDLKLREAEYQNTLAQSVDEPQIVFPGGRVSLFDELSSTLNDAAFTFTTTALSDWAKDNESQLKSLNDNERNVLRKAWKHANEEAKKAIYERQ